MKTSRRNFITKSILTTAGISAGLGSMVKANETVFATHKSPELKEYKESEPFSISIFSKHLQWLGYTEMAELAAEIGFDGVDLTVRPGGHVLPENVESDLPKAMEAVSKTGKKIYMIATSINNADDPLTEKIIKTAASLGIRHYRMSWRYYDETKTIEENIRIIQDGLSRLAEINEKYSISGEYQNHSGTDISGIYFGGSIWDLSAVLKEINSPWLGSQYDVYHANVEGSNAWPVGLKLISPFIRTLDIKDFQWAKKNDLWVAEGVPLGDGKIDYKRYFSILKKENISGPISIHCEYPLGGAESGSKTIRISKEELIVAMKKDLSTLKMYIRDYY